MPESCRIVPGVILQHTPFHAPSCRSLCCTSVRIGDWRRGSVFILHQRGAKSEEGFEGDYTYNMFIISNLEAEVGIEPTHTAFAEPCLTTWLLRPIAREA